MNAEIFKSELLELAESALPHKKYNLNTFVDKKLGILSGSVTNFDDFSKNIFPDIDKYIREIDNVYSTIDSESEKCKLKSELFNALMTVSDSKYFLAIVYKILTIEIKSLELRDLSDVEGNIKVLKDSTLGKLDLHYLFNAYLRDYNDIDTALEKIKLYFLSHVFNFFMGLERNDLKEKLYTDPSYSWFIKYLCFGVDNIEDNLKQTIDVMSDTFGYDSTKSIVHKVGKDLGNSIESFSLEESNYSLTLNQNGVSPDGFIPYSDILDGIDGEDGIRTFLRKQDEKKLWRLSVNHELVFHTEFLKKVASLNNYILGHFFLHRLNKLTDKNKTYPDLSYAESLIRDVVIKAGDKVYRLGYKNSYVDKELGYPNSVSLCFVDIIIFMIQVARMHKGDDVSLINSMNKYNNASKSVNYSYLVKQNFNLADRNSSKDRYRNHLFAVPLNVKGKPAKQIKSKSSNNEYNYKLDDVDCALSLQVVSNAKRNSLDTDIKVFKLLEDGVIPATTNCFYKNNMVRLTSVTDWYTFLKEEVFRGSSFELYVRFSDEHIGDRILGNTKVQDMIKIDNKENN